eukprot:366197-Chlamydomonas_euryale.AAC.27
MDSRGTPVHRAHLRGDKAAKHARTRYLCAAQKTAHQPCPNGGTPTRRPFGSCSSAARNLHKQRGRCTSKGGISRLDAAAHRLDVGQRTGLMRQRTGLMRQRTGLNNVQKAGVDKRGRTPCHGHNPCGLVWPEEECVPWSQHT